MPTYSDPAAASSVEPETLAEALRDIISRADRQLRSVSAEQAAQPIQPGKWSIQQTIGHLVDSCANNLQRLLRLQLTDSLSFPGYSQDDCVRLQRFDLESWDDVLELFLRNNRHFAHTIQQANPDTFHHVWLFEGERLTLAFILNDYLGHLEHHLRKLPGYVPPK